MADIAAILDADPLPTPRQRVFETAFDLAFEMAEAPTLADAMAVLARAVAAGEHRPTEVEEVLLRHFGYALEDVERALCDA